MRITFLGTADGIPTLNRHCSCTLIEVGKTIYLIDAGAPVIDRMIELGKDVNDLRAIFCTHYHGDHNDGLFSLLGLTQWAFRDAEYDVYFSDERIKKVVYDAVSVTAGGVNEERTRLKVAHAGEVYQDENIKITYFPNKHCQPFASYSILVEAEGKKIFFSGDLSVFLNQKDFPKYVLENPTDLFVCELAHFGFDHLGDTLGQIKTKQIYFNHVFPFFRMDEARELDASGKYDFRLIVAKDNDVIDL